MGEFRQAETLQREVWGEDDLPDPADLMMVIQAEGGLVAGAFAAGRLAGYVFGFPTRDPEIQHSHRLAVLDQSRGSGLGLQLKRYQREWCLARGIKRIRWTFDPLQALNATLNIHRLGATSRIYLEDYYGVMGGINSGLASDRLLVDWDLCSSVVTALAAGNARTASAATPLDFALPANLGVLTQTDPRRAHDQRHALRSLLQRQFAEGFAIVDFDREKRHYLLARQE